MSELVSIVYKPLDAAPFEKGYTRVPIEQAQLVAGQGIEGDKKGGSGNRQLNIMAVESTQNLGGDGFQVAPGQLGEQLLVSGVAVDTLPAGARLQIGDSAQVEVVEPRTGCAIFEKHQGKSRQDAAGRLGMMARVVVSGTIRVGDPVQVVEAVLQTA